MSASRKTKAASRRPGRKSKQRKRHSAAEREKILNEAKAANLTGKHVAERYGISTVTYYLWRKQAERGQRKTPSTNGTLASAAEAKLRAAVRAKMTALLPKILDEEADRLLGR